MNMKNEEKIYQLNTYNIAEYTSTDYTDNDIAILGDFKNLLFNKYFKLNANIYVVCVKGRLQININTQKYAIYPGEMLICMPNMILSNCTTSSDFKGAMFCLSTQITQKYLHKSSDIWNKAFYISQNPVVRIDKDRVQLFDLYYKVIRARMKQAEQPYYKEVIRSLIRTMLYELLADLNQLSTPPESQMVKRSNILFKRFLDLLACTGVTLLTKLCTCATSPNCTGAPTSCARMPSKILVSFSCCTVSNAKPKSASTLTTRAGTARD